MVLPLLLILFLLPAPAFSQEIQERVDIDIVNVYLSATDSEQRFVTDLKPGEIILKEDGAVQKIEHFTNLSLEPGQSLGEKGVPMTVAFVIDISNSMSATIHGQTKIDIVKNAALRLLDELRPEDKMTLIAFGDTATQVTPLASDKKPFEQELLFQSVEMRNTALLDAIYFAMEKLKPEFGRKIIVVCSDGEDTASYLRLDEVLSNVVASDVTVLAFGTMALTSSSLKGHYILERLAEASGGYAFFPTSMSMLERVMEKLRKGMRSQYSLGYHPAKKMDGTWRKIEIQCTRPGLKLRYREGYLAKPKP